MFRITRSLSFLACLFGPALVMAGEGDGPVLLPGKTPLSSIAFSKKMDAVAITQDDLFVRVYQFPSMKGIGSFELSVNGGHVSFSPCGQFLLVDGPITDEGTLQILDLFETPPKKIATLSVRERKLRIYPEFSLRDYRFSHDGKSVFALGPGSGFYWWEWRNKSKPVNALVVGGIEAGKYRLQSGYFLADDSLVGLNQKDEIEIHRFDKSEVNFVKTIQAESFGTGNLVFYTSVTPDCNTFVTFNYRDEAVEVHDISRPRSKLVDRLLHYRRLPNGTEKMGIQAVAVTRDRSVIIVVWESRDKEYPGEFIDFFPRTKERAAEFGLKAGQTYLQLESDSNNPSRQFTPVIFSPDGKWFAVRGWQGSAPRIWRVETLGRDLLADKNVKKK